MNLGEGTIVCCLCLMVLKIGNEGREGCDLRLFQMSIRTLTIQDSPMTRYPYVKARDEREGRVLACLKFCPAINKPKPPMMISAKENGVKLSRISPLQKMVV